MVPLCQVSTPAPRQRVVIEDVRRVALVSRIYLPEPSAASLRLSALVTALLEREAEVRVLTTRAPRHLRVREPRTQPSIRRAPVVRDRNGYVRGYVPYLSFDVPLMFRVVFGPPADVYVCEPPPTTGFALLVALVVRRKPYIYYAADIWSDASTATGAPGWVVSAVRSVEIRVLRRAAMVLTVSSGVERRVRELAPSVRTTLVGHGVDLSLFSPDGPSNSEPADVVYVGTASEWHGAELALEALAIVMADRPDLTAAFVGQGSSWDRLRQMVSARGLEQRIRVLPTVVPKEAAAWLRGARVSLATLVPGKGYDFAVPTKIYASVAVGTPVAYAGPDPVRRMIADQDLGASSDYEPSAFAGAIRTVLDQWETRADRRLSAWARENVSSQAVALRSADAVLGAAADGRKGRKEATA